MHHLQTRILANRPVAPGWMELRFAWNEFAGSPEPGQFFTLRASAFTDPLLRRPFAFSDAGHGEAACVYQRRGPVTNLLATLAVGADIDIIAPLGNGFPLPVPEQSAQNADSSGTPGSTILVAGGIGLGPMLFLASRMPAAATFVAGFRTASQLPDLPFPKGSILCTDDGTVGFRGTTADFLASRDWAGPVRLYACGPTPMLASLARMATSRGWEAWLSVEQRMACGVGACMGCAVHKAGGGYLRACADGPVFEAGAIDWEAPE